MISNYQGISLSYTFHLIFYLALNADQTQGQISDKNIVQVHK